MANINIRIDDNLKKDAENLFNDLGLNMTTATTMFLKQCLYCHGLPFEVRMDPFYSRHQPGPPAPGHRRSGRWQWQGPRADRGGG